MKITEKFLSALDRFSLSGGVLVALSGGADSMCMLNLFIAAKKDGLFTYEIVAAHLNHSIRGEESDPDEKFCRIFCEKNGIPFFAKTLDIGNMAKQSGLCTEEMARNARYAFFEEILRDNPSLSYVATAHNKEDVCETMLLNLVRGSGIDGLRSIPERRDNIIRPMLDISRAEILEYSEKTGIEYVTDSTNLTDEYNRNKIRHNVLPALSKISEGYLDCISRTAALLSRDAEFMNSEAEKAYAECVKNRVLYTEKAQNLHSSVLSRVVKMLYNHSGFSSLEETHIRAVCEQIANGKKNFSLSLHGCSVLCERGRMRFTEKCEAAEYEIETEVGKEIALPNGISVTLSKEWCEGAVPLRAEALCGRLMLRSRKNGDCIRLFGKNHKIKRMISDKKLGREEKARLFFLTCDDEIIYTNLPAVADKAFTKKGGENSIFISVKETL